MNKTLDEWEEENNLLQDRVDELTQDLENVQEAAQEREAELETALEFEKSKLQDEFKNKLKAVNRDAKERLIVMEREIDRMRSAFSGDSSGWVQKVSKNGTEYYENENTGEVRDEEPEVIVIAKAMQRVQKADEYLEELTGLRKKYKQTDMAMKEATMKVNKQKTEMNSLKNIDRLWKDAAKSVYVNLTRVGNHFDSHFDQMMDSMNSFKRTNKRIINNLPGINSITEVITNLQNRVFEQENTISDLKSKNSTLTKELSDSREMVRKLTTGMEEEVERLTRPMRERMAESMTGLMKEKAARAQERRDLADIWPPTHIMPTVLMKSRTLNDNERKRRQEMVYMQEASRALGAEIRANLQESKMWEVKYDDYGRPFYEHKKTGEVRTEEPEIISYKPPPGRDENGNAIMEAEDLLWELFCDAKGEVYYKHARTQVVSYHPPNIYQVIPPCKPRELVVGEAALMVVRFLREKVEKHTRRLKYQKEDEDDDAMFKKEEKEINAQYIKEAKIESKNLKDAIDSGSVGGDGDGTGANLDGVQSVSSEPSVVQKAREALKRKIEKKKRERREEREAAKWNDDNEDLSKYFYDIDTVEMLALAAGPLKALVPKEDEDEEENDNDDPRQFVRDIELAKKAVLNAPLVGPKVSDVKLEEMKEDDIRSIVEHYASIEDGLEEKLSLCRYELKEFSYILLDVIKNRKMREAHEKEMQKERLRLEKEEKKKQRREAKLAARKQRAEDDGISLTELSLDSGSIATGSLLDGNSMDISRITGTGEEGIPGADVEKNKNNMIDPDSGLPLAKEIEDLEPEKNDGAAKGSGPEVGLDGEEDGSLAQQSLQQRSLTSELTGNDMVANGDVDDTYEAPVLSDTAIGNNNKDNDGNTVNGDGDEEIQPGLNTNNPLRKAPVEIEAILSEKADKLASFAMYCGFSNLKIEDAPFDANMQYNFNFKGIDDTKLVDKVDKNGKIINSNDPANEKSIIEEEYHIPQPDTASKMGEKEKNKSKTSDNKINNSTNNDHEEGESLVSQAKNATNNNMINVGEDNMSDVDNNVNSNDYPNAKIDISVIEEIAQDDEWLTGSFFIAVTADKVDALRHATMTNNNDIMNDLNLKHLRTLRLSDSETKDEDLNDLSEEEKRKPWMASVRFINDKIRMSHALWKNKQLFAEVLKLQIQNEAVKGVYENRDGMKDPKRRKELSLLPPGKVNVDMVAKFKVQRVLAVGVPSDPWIENQTQFIKISIGTWSARLETQRANNRAMRWESLDESVIIDLNRLQLDLLTVEAYDESSLRSDTLIAAGTTYVNSALGHAIDRHVDLKCKLRQPNGKDGGVVDITVIVTRIEAENNDISLASASYGIEGNGTDNKGLDPEHLIPTETNIPNHKIYQKSIELQENEDLLSGVFPSMTDQRQTFAGLVRELRGDIYSQAKMLTGDISAIEMLKRGYRSTPDTVKELPNFAQCSVFLKRKENMFQMEIDTAEEEILEQDDIILNMLEERKNESQRLLDISKKKYKSVYDGAQNIRTQLEEVMIKIRGLRDARPRPTEPVKPETRDISVHPIPTTGGLDANGKKKKALKKEEFKACCDALEQGNIDRGEWMKYFGEMWPNAAQLTKLKKLIEARVQALQDLKLQDELNHKRKIGEYEAALTQYDNDDRKRVEDYEKMKKECRRVNLKYDCFSERSKALLDEVNSLEYDCITWKRLSELHGQSKGRYTVLRTKQILERERHLRQIKRLSSKLLRLVEARRRALELPAGAQNDLQFESLRKSSEDALRAIRFEIIDVRSELVGEGARMRVMWEEAVGSCKSEYTRIRMLREVILQRKSIQTIVARHRYEAMHLYEALEKLKLAESQRDDVGLDTLDGAGERYLLHKKWESPEINALQKQIAPIQEKIDLTQNLVETSGSSQRAILENMANKWGCEYFAVRDSWIENSDYERGQRLLNDVVQWVTIQRDRLGSREKELTVTRDELLSELEAARDETEIMVRTNDTETSKVTESTSNAIKVVKTRLEEVRVAAKEKSAALEKSITDLSRQGQKLREDTLSQSLLYEDKITTLFSVISTLQATLSKLAARIEVIQEERDKVVLKAKVDSDKAKQQLRAERRHCSNLMMIIHAQRGTMKKLRDQMLEYKESADAIVADSKDRKAALRRQIWEQVFAVTRLATDVDDLFEFFTSRLASIAGSRKFINDAINRNNGAVVLSALCKSPKQMIRRYAARALAGMGWDSFTESRVIMWDCVDWWNKYRIRVVSRDNKDFKDSATRFEDTGTYDAIISNEKDIPDEFEASPTMTLREIIKHRRQWALRVTRRNEGPNKANQKLLNIQDDVIPTLLNLVESDGKEDWEVVRSSMLTLSIASLDETNHKEMANDEQCAKMIVNMCAFDDPEVRTHAAITIANLCHKDETSQAIFGEWGAIPSLLDNCKLASVDLLEGSTAALSNLTCYCDFNCRRVMEYDGVPIILEIVTRAYSENLLDLDQNDEVQANAIEILANVSRFSCELTVDSFNPDVINGLIVLCASNNIQIQRHVPLVFGNIAQNETCRAHVGDRGGIEALFLILEKEDNAIIANTLWSLCNLMWYPPNQERAGRFMSEILLYMNHPFLPVKQYACVLLANMLYYNNGNRVRFLETDGSMEQMLKYIDDRDDPNANSNSIIIEACLRAVLSLSYLDQVSLWLGTDGNCIPLFIQLLYPPFASRDSLKYSIEILCNLCMHHVCRKLILDNNGLDVLVNLQNDVDPHIQEVAQQIISHMEDITPEEVLVKQKLKIGLDRMMILASDADPLVRSVAAESIGEEVWLNPVKQAEINAMGGVETLLSILRQPNERIETLLPALWSLRNLLHNNQDAQIQLNDFDGIQTTLDILSYSLTGRYEEHTEKVIEGCLALLVNGIYNSDRNSRKMLRLGLEIVMDIADARILNSAGVIANTYVSASVTSEGIVALAKSILQMLGPYNYVVCRTCHRKQEISGTHCMSCGAQLLVDVPSKQLQRQIQKMSVGKSKQLEKKKDKKERTKKALNNLMSTTGDSHEPGPTKARGSEGIIKLDPLSKAR